MEPNEARSPFLSLGTILGALLIGVGAVTWMFGGNLGHVGSFLVGVVLLLVGGKWLVDGAVVIARRIGWSTLTIGLTIVACGTSLPELAFTLFAAGRGNGELAFGNVVGSNIANIGLVLGIASLMRPIDVHGRVIRVEVPLLVVVSTIMLGLGWFPRSGPHGYEQVDGLILLVIFVVVFALWYRSGQRESADPLMREAQREVEEAGDDRPLWLMIALFVVGLALLVGGAWVTEEGAVGIATWFGMSQALIGLTIVAVATSLPEIATTIAACLKGHTDLAVGNVVGSNLFNILLVLGATSAVAPPVPVPPVSGWHDLGAMMAMTVVLTVIVLTQTRVTRVEGFLLLLLYLAYMSWSVARELMS